MMGNVANKGESAEALIATLGVEPQVVTITLDQLLARGRSIGEVVVVYTLGPGVGEALAAIEAEFAKGLYPGGDCGRSPLLAPGARLLTSAVKATCGRCCAPCMWRSVAPASTG